MDVQRVHDTRTVSDTNDTAIALCGINAYDYIEFSILGVSNTIYFIGLGERHDPPKVGCNNHFQALFPDAREWQGYSMIWVHQFIHAIMEAASRNDRRMQRSEMAGSVRIGERASSVLHLLENPTHEFEPCWPKDRYPETQRQCISVLNASTHGKELALCKRRSGGSMQMEGVADINMRLTPQIRRSALQNMRDSLCSSNRSALTSLRKMYDSCNRKQDDTKACPLDARDRIEVYHFDLRMIRIAKGGFGAIINPFTDLCNVPSFMDALFGRIQSDAKGSHIRPRFLEGSVTERLGIVKFIIGPLFPKKYNNAQVEQFKQSVLKKCEVYLTQKWNPGTSSYTIQYEDLSDQQGAQSLKSVSEIGNPTKVMTLIREMVAMAHQEMMQNAKEAAKSTSATLVERIITHFVQYIAFVYTRPQVQNTWHAYYTMRLGHDVHASSMSAKDVQKLRTKWFDGEPTSHFSTFNMHQALVQMRKQNVLSLMTDTFTDLNSILKMIANIGKGTRRVLLYGGLAHVKNISRFLVYVANGPSAVPPETQYNEYQNHPLFVQRPIRKDGPPIVRVHVRRHQRCEFTAPMPPQIVYSCQTDSLRGEDANDPVSSRGLFRDAKTWIHAPSGFTE